MATEIRLPQEGMAMTEGTVVKWQKAAGAIVEAGEVVAEAEADKTTFEILAPASGILGSILVPEGETVPVRTVLATIVASGEVTELAGAAPSAPIQVVPAARRLAKENNLDLTEVTGTGPGGRITEQDVRAVLESTAPKQVLPSAAADQVIPLRGVRGRVAERMWASLQSMAQLTLMTEVDVTELVRWREAAKADWGVTYTHLLVRASALALRKHPRLNAVVEDNEIRLRQHIHIGIAVPLRDGLIVPVIRNVDQMTLADVVATAQAIVTQVSERQATPDLVTGSTFTVSNLGTFGIDGFTPVINPPEVAILGVGRIIERPARAAEGIAWRNYMTLSLTIDHRAVDGVPGAEFLQTLASLLQQPEVLFEEQVGM